MKEILELILALFYKFIFNFVQSIRTVQNIIFKKKPVVNFKESGLKVSLIKQIGEGGYSFVYFGKDQNGKNYAVKKALIQSKEQKEQTDNEIDTMKKIKSPFLLNLIDDKKEPHETYFNFYNHYLLLPFVEQGSLQDVLDKRLFSGNPMKEKRIWTVFQKICKGVEALHMAKPPLAHRDLKLGNVLIDATFTPLIMDFGSVSNARVEIRSREEAIKLSDWAGMHCTNAYRPPELLDCPSEIDIDERTDIWSLGCVLYAMAFGQSPFENKDGATSVTLAVFSGEIPVPKDNVYSEQFLNCVRWMLNLNAAERPFIKDVLSRVGSIVNK